MKFFSAVAKSYADVVTLIEGIFVAQSIGSKKNICMINEWTTFTKFQRDTKLSSQRISIQN